ncbi:MAG: DeoR/GlpR family DNA-binding transcription regulator [Acholeplasmataceae bacterium]|nr:DeoR/GlpR family DNA-binding transcription regulator [Acholeplasmataceae bacterium]
MVRLIRQDEILALLAKDKVASVVKLAQKLYVSEATVRRDLVQMEKIGLIRRTHGGALLAHDNARESAFATRESDHHGEKKAICAMTVEHIQDHSVIFIDSGSTLLPIVEMLARFTHMSIITHGIRTALMLSGLENTHVFVAGGMIENFSNSILGSPVQEFYRSMNADIALMSCSGIDNDGNITDDSLEQSRIKQTMVQKAKKIYVLCDSSKFGKTRMNTGFNIDQVDILFTDKSPDEPLLSRIKASKCQIIIPGQAGQKGPFR